MDLKLFYASNGMGIGLGLMVKVDDSRSKGPGLDSFHRTLDGYHDFPPIVTRLNLNRWQIMIVRC